MADRCIKIQDARELAQRFGKDAVIVFHIKDDLFGYVSYGKDKQECARARRLADRMYEVVVDA